MFSAVPRPLLDSPSVAQCLYSSCRYRPMLNPTPNSTAIHKRRTRWALTGLEAGAILFVAGLAALYFNPFWHFDEGGFLDHRVYWWNAAGEILTAAGLTLEAFALAGAAAGIVSRWV